MRKKAARDEKEEEAKAEQQAEKKTHEAKARVLKKQETEKDT